MPGLTTSIMKRTPHLHFRTNLVTQYPTPGSRWNRPPGRTQPGRTHHQCLYSAPDPQQSRSLLVPRAIGRPLGFDTYRPHNERKTLLSQAPLCCCCCRVFPRRVRYVGMRRANTSETTETIRSTSPFVMRPKKHKFQ